MQSQPSFLILGATGSIGYAVAENLLHRRLPVTLLVRSRAKAEALFPKQPNLTIAEGDVMDVTLLKRLSADKTHIFHGINYPYNRWFGNMDRVTANVIEAASQNRATLVFPGNIYQYGLTTEPIREDSHPNPCSRKGRLRLELETMMEKAVREDRCRLLTVRMPDFWGPNVLNDGVRPIFENALKGKALPWLSTIDIPHQAVYTPDAAELIVRLMLRPEQKPVEVWNYGGPTFPSMRWFFEKLTEQAGKPLKTTIYSRTFVTIMGLFMPVLREVKEMLYLYENTVVLDDRRLRALFPDFRETPLEKALADTLAWFRSRQKAPVQANLRYSPGVAPVHFLNER